MWKNGVYWQAYFSENQADLCTRDILSVNTRSKEYLLEEGVDELCAQFVDGNGMWYSAQYLDRFLFDALYEKVRGEFNVLRDENKYDIVEEWKHSGNYSFDSTDGVIPKEMVWKGIRCELNPSELCSIIQKPYEIADYYDFDLIMAGVRKYENGVISPSYYGDWCVLLLCLNSHPYKSRRQLSDLYYRIADIFDGEGFLDKEKHPSDRLGEIRELVAELKWLDHQIRNEKRFKNRAFSNKAVKVFVQFDYYNGGADSQTYKFLIVSERSKKFNLLYVDDPLFDDGINYIFCNNDIDDIVDGYFRYERNREFGLEFIPKNLKEYLKNTR